MHPIKPMLVRVVFLFHLMVFILSPNLIESLLTGSSFGAELVALRRGVVQALRILPLLKGLGYSNVQITAHCDNLPVIKRVTNRFADDLIESENLLNGSKHSFPPIIIEAGVVLQ